MGREICASRRTGTGKEAAIEETTKTRKQMSQDRHYHERKQQLRRLKQASRSEDWKHHRGNNTQKRNANNSKKMEQGDNKKQNEQTNQGQI